MNLTLYILPYDNDVVTIQKKRDDGMHELTIFDTLGYQTYEAQKRAFDMSQSKPYFKTNDPTVVMKNIERMATHIVKDVVEDCGYEFANDTRKIHRPRHVDEVGVTDEYLVFIASRTKYDGEVDCRVTKVRTKEVEKPDIFGRNRVFEVGGYSYSHYDTMKTLADDIERITPGEGLARLLKIMEIKRKRYIQDFLDYCEVEQ